jgi:hypothetical protein
VTAHSLTLGRRCHLLGQCGGEQGLVDRPSGRHRSRSKASQDDRYQRSPGVRLVRARRHEVLPPSRVDPVTDLRDQLAAAPRRSP